jgi:hypothetical protein
VVKLKFEAAGKGASSFEDEVFDLKLALPKDQAVFRLAKGAHRYVDLFHTEKSTPRPNFSPDFVRTPARLAILGWGAGTYRVEILASAENAASVHRIALLILGWQFPRPADHRIHSRCLQRLKTEPLYRRTSEPPWVGSFLSPFLRL